MATTRKRVEVREGPGIPSPLSPTCSRDGLGFDEPGPSDWLAEVLNRHAAVGLAVAVIRPGREDALATWGFADLAAGRRVDGDTVFRIGSVSKVMTALAVMQLRDRGELDLDAPAQTYLRGFRLVPARAGLAAPTVRHLLTHTGGIAEVQHVRDLLQRGAGPFGSRPAMPSVPAGEAPPSLSAYYRNGLPVVAEPGTTFAYTNHGYATLGQIVEEVSGLPLDRYFREWIFDPLGMPDTGLVRSPATASRLATGYAVGAHGVAPVPDRDWAGAASGGVYSTPRDLGRFAAAVLGGGGNDHGSVLAPATLSEMFEPHHRPDPRVPGWGLGFARGALGAHRLVGHDGVLPGFNTSVLVAPDDGVAVVGLTNGSPGAFVWLDTELKRLLRLLLGEHDEGIRTDVPQHPEVWGPLCGTYRLPARVSDLRGRMALSGGAQVLVRGGRLVLRGLAPVPSLLRGLPLHPDDEDDPYVFRLDLTALGMPPARVVFGRDPDTDRPALHADLGGQPLTLVRREARRHG